MLPKCPHSAKRVHPCLYQYQHFREDSGRAVRIVDCFVSAPEICQQGNTHVRLRAVSKSRTSWHNYVPQFCAGRECVAHGADIGCSERDIDNYLGRIRVLEPLPCNELVSEDVCQLTILSATRARPRMSTGTVKIRLPNPTAYTRIVPKTKRGCQCRCLQDELHYTH